MKELVLLRGLIRESRHWGDFPQRIENQIPKVKVLTPDIYGVGKYIDRQSSTSFESMVEELRSQLPQKTVPRYLLAISLGGMIAKCWSEKYPDDFDGVLLINTSFRGLHPLWWRLQPKALISVIQTLFMRSVEQRERNILRLVSNSLKGQEKAYPQWLEIQKSSPVSYISFFNQIIAALKFRPQRENTFKQLMILASKGDRLCNYRCSEVLARLWKAPLFLHDSAGHDFAIDDPEWIIEKIEAFIGV